MAAFRRIPFLIAIGASLMLCALTAATADAAPTPMVDLGQTTSYAALSGASVDNTVSAPGAPHTTIRGDLGVKANTAPGGFPPGVVTGAIRFGGTVDQAHADLSAAYSEIGSRQGGTPQAGALAGATLLPGLYTITGAASNTGTLTLNGNGDPDSVFVFQVSGALSFAAASHVVLANKAQASRVFWQVVGAGAVGAGSDFAGTLIAKDAVAMGNGTLVNGRAFARDGAMTLDNNQFYGSPPTVTIDGGGTGYTTDTTPTISGTTDVEAPATVDVTVDGQTLIATPAGGTWSVTSAILANGTYPVVASVEDAAGNTGSATQQLTVDTVPPVIVIDGGASVSTNDPTPTIGGTTDVAVDTVVSVTIGGQALRALVHAGGVWNVRAATLTDGTHTATAAVSDPAGNESSDVQSVTVDTASPALTITGGTTALTNDATPRLSGTAGLPPGSSVTVDVNNETLVGLVDGAGGWSVDASQLGDGPHRVVASASDAAGNRSDCTQMLTVDTVSPQVTIDGGPAATTDDPDPTISGTSDAVPGTTVSVSVAGQAMTTLVQADGSWNTNPGNIGQGTWHVIASVLDPAGNVGTAEQSLAIGVVTAPVTHDLTMSKTGSGHGSVTSSPAGSTCGADCRGTYTEGSMVTVTAEPATGSTFSGWGGDCSGSSTCTVMMDRARSVSAAFTDDVPVIASLRVAPGRVHLRGRSRTAMSRLGPAVRADLTEAASVSFTITRRFTRTLAFSRQFEAGPGSIRIPSKLRRSLKRGSYRLSAVATDSAGQDSKAFSTGFKPAP